METIKTGYEAMPQPCSEILSCGFFRAQWLKMESTRTGYEAEFYQQKVADAKHGKPDL